MFTQICPNILLGSKSSTVVGENRVHSYTVISVHCFYIFCACSLYLLILKNIKTRDSLITHYYEYCLFSIKYIILDVLNKNIIFVIALHHIRVPLMYGRVCRYCIGMNPRTAVYF